jgi:HAD superfamily hydrolase (TIGR01509 family)
VLFDVDGTLVDNSYLHTLAWWRACRELGSVVPMARLHRLIGMGADQLTQRLFDREWPELSEAHDRHIEPLFDEMLPFDGAGELLRQLRESGLAAVLASSAKSGELARLREIIGSESAECEAVSSADAATSKPAPDIFAAALSKATVPRDHAIGVGDTGWDVISAGRSGLACIAVESGGWSAEELRQAGAVAVYRDVGQLLDELASSPLAKLGA